ncbi:MAG: ECF-type sigma factor [Planctomycetota bacterium]
MDHSHDVTRILSAIGRGDAASQEQLLALVYDELRQLARSKVAHERPGHSLQATALVHEAYVRLFGSDSPTFQNRRHFFKAAATAMERILVEGARRDQAAKRGGNHGRVALHAGVSAEMPPSIDVLALGEAIDQLENESPRAAFVVRLRYFIGLSIDETAEVLEVSSATVRADWTMSKAWLRVFLERERGE